MSRVISLFPDGIPKVPDDQGGQGSAAQPPVPAPPVRRRAIRPEDYIRRSMMPTSLDMNRASPWEQHNYRNRHGRGQRQPMFMRSLPRERTFCGMVEQAMASCYKRLAALCPVPAASVQWCIDDVPASDPLAWESDEVPMSRAFPAGGGEMARVVLYWRVIRDRAFDLADMEALVHDEMVLRLSELMAISPDDIDPLWTEE